MLCTPIARPDQKGPPSSATAVNARPLLATVTAVAAIMIATARGVSSSTPRATIVTSAATATMRIGPSRLPTRSDHQPTPMRAAAPSSWVEATSAPAAVVDHCRSSMSHTSMYVHTVICGMTRSIDATWMRPRRELPRYGLASCPLSAASARLGRGGSTTRAATMTVVAAHTIAGMSRAARSPCASAVTGTMNAASPMPSGSAVCRIPIAVPRRWGGNQPTTSRPLAELVLAAPTPASSQKSPRPT